MLFSWVLWYLTDNILTLQMNDFLTWSYCIIDENNPWRMVPWAMYEAANLHSFHRWFLFWVACTTTMFILGSLGFAWALSKLARMRNHGWDFSHRTLQDQTAHQSFLAPSMLSHNAVNPTTHRHVAYSAIHHNPLSTSYVA